MVPGYRRKLMALSEALMQNLLDVISNIVNAEGPYREKRDEIMDYCSHDEETNLLEFVTWFEGVDEEDVVDN
jgi:hypothetical protein